jgi:hypothetical protein
MQLTAGKSSAFIRTEQRVVGRLCDELVRAGDVDHVGGIRLLARRIDLKRAFFGRARSRGARRSRRHNVGKRRSLGTGWSVLAPHCARYRPALGCRRELGSFDQKPLGARGLVRCSGAL